jgi:uncharacterized protein with PQ loop repeat
VFETIGYIGGIAFAIAAFPQAYKCYKDGHAEGLSLWFLILLSVGEVCSFIYSCFISAPFSEKIPYLLNYGFNIALLVVFFKYKLQPKEERST